MTANSRFIIQHSVNSEYWVVVISYPYFKHPIIFWKVYIHYSSCINRMRIYLGKPNQQTGYTKHWNHSNKINKALCMYTYCTSSSVLFVVLYELKLFASHPLENYVLFVSTHPWSPSSLFLIPFSVSFGITPPSSTLHMPSLLHQYYWQLPIS